MCDVDMWSHERCVIIRCRTSGMAALVLSVTTRYCAWPDMPSPKPMVTPSISATRGLRMRAMLVMRLYSAARAVARAGDGKGGSEGSEARVEGGMEGWMEGWGSLPACGVAPRRQKCIG